ncbi:MAG: hypothetical protein MSC30_05735 [Gaiellaceae bacterium MAG52_C11]|nr:hypothetical protein [Candidatus Gaiellasilicea maunaloa]
MRAGLERRVDELASEHSGQAFAAAVAAYADTLDLAEREELGAILLERAGGPEQAIRHQYEERSWFRRALRRIDGERPER